MQGNESDYKPYKIFSKQYENISKPSKIVYEPNGEKNSPIARDLQTACYASVKKLKEYLVEFMMKNDYDIKFGENYIFCVCESGNEKQVMLTAHLDTVQNPRGAQVIYVERKDNKHYLWSPHGIGGDDRCGIVAIKRLIERGLRPTVLFCDKEEKGGLGSEEFCSDYVGKLNLNCIIELDRKGNNDLVFYDENNREWKEYLTKLTGWKEAGGSFSDICNLYDFGCASVNLSVGYYKQHTTDEYIVLEDWENGIDVTERIIKSIDKKWEHQQA